MSASSLTIDIGSRGCSAATPGRERAHDRRRRGRAFRRPRSRDAGSSRAAREALDQRSRVSSRRAVVDDRPSAAGRSVWRREAGRETPEVRRLVPRRRDDRVREPPLVMTGRDRLASRGVAPSARGRYVASQTSSIRIASRSRSCALAPSRWLRDERAHRVPVEELGVARRGREQVVARSRRVGLRLEPPVDRRGEEADLALVDDSRRGRSRGPPRLSSVLRRRTARTLSAAGIVAQYSTSSWSRNGTRTSSECAIDARSK